MTSFREAMDALCLTSIEVGELFDAPAQSVRQWRLDAEHRNYRPAPPDWPRRFLPIAKKRGRELEQLVAELERAAGRGR